MRTQKKDVTETRNKTSFFALPLFSVNNHFLADVSRKVFSVRETMEVLPFFPGENCTPVTAKNMYKQKYQKKS